MNATTTNTNTFYLDTIDPSNLLQSSSTSNASPESFFPNDCTSIDDWLADELCKEGLLANAMDFNPEKILALLPHTPPISPPTSVKHEPASPSVPLFPEIAKQKPILPKVNLPRIAPRPCPTVAIAPMKPLVAASPVMMSQQKRRSDSICSSPAADQDEIALKRQKNTDAARRSRLKKLVKMEQLEGKVSDLETDNHLLTTRIAVLESEKLGLQMKDVSLEERIRVLEAQLSEAHRALTKV
ncbi:hypothetical protein INT46_005815 [Mucor plumbeus]|jgi:hypothetical protein|uniref:BZIP domain-containing protein n=1 Tax=Mucor plumbeus TaxID=97098 RepID=A0A8H7QPS7_9FUNG|nr:hypothetical protein INT46_005815 [Mucor plumbeus]